MGQCTHTQKCIHNAHGTAIDEARKKAAPCTAEGRSPQSRARGEAPQRAVRDPLPHRPQREREAAREVGPSNAPFTSTPAMTKLLP